MPSAWVHATIDLIAFGLPYLNLHQQKDKAHQTMGPEHRVVDHGWYQQFGNRWTFADPFPNEVKESTREVLNAEGPEKAEELQAWISHDYIDKIWDTLSARERKYREGFFAWLLLRPEILKSWAEVDVIQGKIHRVVRGSEMWEDCPQVKSEYRRLCKYVQKVIEKDGDLQEMLELYGGQ